MKTRALIALARLAVIRRLVKRSASVILDMSLQMMACSAKVGHNFVVAIVYDQ